MGWGFCSSSGWWETYGVFVGCYWQGEQPNTRRKPFPVPLRLSSQIPRTLPKDLNPGMPGERLVTNRLSHDAAFRDVILGKYRSGISRFLSIYMQMNESTCTQPKGLSYLSSNIRFTSKWRICLSQMQPCCYALVHTLPLKSSQITKTLCLWRDGCMCELLLLIAPLSIPSMTGGWLWGIGGLITGGGGKSEMFEY